MTDLLTKLLIGSILFSAGFLFTRVMFRRRNRKQETSRPRTAPLTSKKPRTDYQKRCLELESENTQLMGKLQIFQTLCDDLIAGRERHKETLLQLEDELTRTRQKVSQLSVDRDELANALSKTAIEVEGYEEKIEHHVKERDDAFDQGFELVERIQFEVQSRLQSLVDQRDQACVELNNARQEIKSLKDHQTNEDLANRRSQEGEQAYPRIMASARQMDGQYPLSPPESLTTMDPLLGVVFNMPPEFKDDLKKISGIAAVLETRLNELGIYTYKQIIGWNQSVIQEFSKRLSFKDRIERDQWQTQANLLYLEKYGSRAA